MKKRIISVLLCVVFIAGLLPLTAVELNNVNAEEAVYGDRIMYGGTAVDIGEDTIVSSEGALWRIERSGEKVFLAEAEAKYLNYFENEIWFASGDKIIKCGVDCREFITVCELESEIKCLYVDNEGFLYLRGDTVYRNSGGREEPLLVREGIDGFVPEGDGKIRWIRRNPDYEYTEESGDEIFSDGNDEFFEYISQENSGEEGDTAASAREYGVETASSEEDYNGPYVQVGEARLPLAEHMPGTFFSKNGQACVCHHTSSTYCIQSVGNCNCMRYYPTGYKETCEIDLLGAQCFAFARMVFWKCFGFIDHSMNQSLYYSAGSLSSGAVTANSVKALMMKSAPGAHVRLAAGHSVSVLTYDEDFIVIYHGNAGGDGVISQPCIVSTRRYTWEQWANACAKGILYVNMPYSYPNSELIVVKKEVGYYKLKSNLNLRAEANTMAESLCVIPNGEIISVTEVDGFWGKASYGEFEGWVLLEYASFYSRLEINPSSTLFTLGDDGFLLGTAWNLSFDAFCEHFDKQSLTAKSKNGEDLTAKGYIGTGSIITLEVNGELIDSAVVCLAGDINGNGVLDVGDYILARRAYMQTYTPSETEAKAADVSGSGSVDIYDYLLIKRYFFTESAELFSGFGKQAEGEDSASGGE